MKVAVVFVLLFATVLCRPARKVSVSSSESSEEVNSPPAAEPPSQKAAEVPQYRQAPAEAAAEAVTDPTSSPDTDSDSQDSADSDEDDDEDDVDDAEESETEEDDTSESSESGESSTPAPATVEPATEEHILPTIVTDMETARGDSLGGYPTDHKSIDYVEEKSYHKVPSPYKSYEFMGTGKKMAYDMTEGNEVDKSVKVYKTLQVHNDLLEEDTSTPEVESLDPSEDQDISTRQASLPKESTGEAAPSESESSSTTEEEEEESAASASTSEESEAESSQSDEETPATDSDSDESAGSDSDEEGAGVDTTTDLPAVLTAK